MIESDDVWRTLRERWDAELPLYGFEDVGELERMCQRDLLMSLMLGCLQDRSACEAGEIVGWSTGDVGVARVSRLI